MPIQPKRIAWAESTNHGNSAENPTKEFDFKFALRRAPAHITVKLGEHNLLRWLDTFIFQATLTGDLDKLHGKWLGGPMTAPLPPL